METNDIIEVSISLDAKDREKAMDYNLFVKRKLVLIDILFFVILALTLIFLNLFGIFDIPNGLVYCSYGVLVMICVFLIFVKMMSTAGGNSPTRYITITPQALTTHVGGEKKEFTIRWEDFVHTGKTKNYYFLYPDHSQFLILPKRYFTAKEIKEINGYLT